MTKKKDKKSKPRICVFCQSDYVEMYHEIFYPGDVQPYIYYYIICKECNASGPSDGNELKALDRWNRKKGKK